MPATICPSCQGRFREVIREGILIDICTQCQGVWLDRGELEKLIDLSRQDLEIPLPPPAQPRPPARDRDHYEGRDFTPEQIGQRRRIDLGGLFDPED